MREDLKTFDDDALVALRDHRTSDPSASRDRARRRLRFHRVPQRHLMGVGGNATFADGFAGGRISSPSQAANQPIGVATGPDGALYVSDSLRGRIWKILAK